MLVLLLSGRRSAAIAKLKTADIGFNAYIMTIFISDLCKQSSPGYHQKPLVFSTPQFSGAREAGVSASVVSRQVFGGTEQIETRLEKPRRVETGFETT